MDRRRFLETAPNYYSIAIVAYFSNSMESLAYKDAIQASYTFKRNGYLVENLNYDDLFEKGAKIAVDLGLLEIIKDDFGPDLFKLTDNSWQQWQALAADRGSLYYKYDAAGDTKHAWLLKALRAIAEKYEELGILAEDFHNPDAEWEPIPLDRKDPQLEAVIKNLDAVAEHLRGDNGYSARHGEEKIYVFEKIKSVTRRLKEDATISWLYLREFAVEPLLILGRRFGNSAIGIAAEAAKAALKEWLKNRAINILDNIQ